MKVREVLLRRVDMPLDRPYPLSFNQVDMASFDAVVAEVRDSDGRVGWGEVTILPGYTHDLSEPSIARRCCGDGVEFGANFQHSRQIAALQGLPKPLVDSPQLCNLALRYVGRGKAGRVAFDHQAYGIELVNVLCIDLCDDRNALGTRFHQSACEQALDGLPNRRPADAKAGDEVALRDLIAGAQRTLQDLAYRLLEDAIGCSRHFCLEKDTVETWYGAEIASCRIGVPLR